MPGYFDSSDMATKGLMDSLMSLTSNIPQILGYSGIEYIQQMAMTSLPRSGGFSQAAYWLSLGLFDTWKAGYSNSVVVVTKG